MRTNKTSWACGVALVVASAMTGGCTDRALHSVDKAIDQLNQGNKTFADIKTILEDTKGKLDKEEYKGQVADLIDRTSKVSEIGVAATVDFTRERVIEDLKNLKRTMTGQPPNPRVPVLANAGLPAIDLKSSTRSTVTIVGWNLDVAKDNPDSYKVVIQNERKIDKGTEKTERSVDAGHISFQGQYALALDVSSTGIAFKPWDKKVVFQGYKAVFEIPILNSAPPPPPERIVSVSGNIKTTNQNREGGVCIIELMDGDTSLWSHKFPEKPEWGDWHDEPFTFKLNAAVPASPRFLITLTQTGAKEVNILWRFEAKAEFHTDRDRTITFGQSGLELHCGDGRPVTVSTVVNHLK